MMMIAFTASSSILHPNAALLTKVHRFCLPQQVLLPFFVVVFRFFINSLLMSSCPVHNCSALLCLPPGRPLLVRRPKRGVSFSAADNHFALGCPSSLWLPLWLLCWCRDMSELDPALGSELVPCLGMDVAHCASSSIYLSAEAAEQGGTESSSIASCFISGKLLEMNCDK